METTPPTESETKWEAGRGGGMMIEALVKPYLLENVKEALSEMGIVGLTVSEVRDFAVPEPGAGPFVPRLKLEIVVPEELLRSAMEQVVSSGQIPENEINHIHVQRLTDVVRIRTAENGKVAI